MHIRAMEDRDVEAVSALLGASWRRTYAPVFGEETTRRVSAELHQPARIRAELDDDNIMSFVAERPDGSIGGYAMARMDKRGEVALDRLHVDVKEFGTGMGADLLHAVLAAHAGIASLSLEVLEGNDRALAFYRKHGFEVVARQEDAHGATGHASLLLRRALPRA